MEYRQLGGSDLKVSALALGTNNFGRRMPDPANAARIIATAVEHGVNLIDTSDDYGGDHVSERFIGDAIKGMRDRVIIATKVGNQVGGDPKRAGASFAHVLSELEKSLRALGTDYVDLYLIHRPDPQTPIEETLRALDEVVRAGKVRYVGCSNFAAWETCDAVWTAKANDRPPFVCVQPEYSMLRRDAEPEMLPFCAEYGIGVMPYYPLAGGMLTGKYRRGEAAPAGSRMALASNQASRWMRDDVYDAVERVGQFCQETGHAMVDVALAWLLARGEVSSVIVGASTPEQVAANAASAELRLTADEKTRLDDLVDTGTPLLVGGAAPQARGGHRLGS
jgi:aryl-alcohol dehydrogenase-like predicted oxidoreductase